MHTPGMFTRAGISDTRDSARVGMIEPSPRDSSSSPPPSDRADASRSAPFFRPCGGVRCGSGGRGHRSLVLPPALGGVLMEVSGDRAFCDSTGEMTVCAATCPGTCMAWSCVRGDMLRQLWCGLQILQCMCFVASQMRLFPLSNTNTIAKDTCCEYPPIEGSLSRMWLELCMLLSGDGVSSQARWRAAPAFRVSS